MIPMYNTVTFNNVFKDFETFKEAYNQCGLPHKITEDSLKTTYYLLVARYGNNPIANQDINQFKIKTFAVIFQYGPTWEKRLTIQDKLRNLSDEELMKGSTTIYNTAMNPNALPTNQSMEELDYIAQQNTGKHKRSKLDAYMFLTNMLEDDVTEAYIVRFRSLFKLIVAPENTVLYGEDCEE